MKLVKGYEEYFSVSTTGKIFSHRTKKFLKVRKCNGYFTFTTRLGGRSSKAKTLKVHRLVAETYIPNPNNLPFINHIDGNKLNNDVSNLEWVTHKENVEHALSLGLYSTGTKPKNAKLTNEQVLFLRTEINNRIGSKEAFYRHWANKLNVGKMTIKQAILGMRYKNAVGDGL